MPFIKRPPKPAIRVSSPAGSTDHDAEQESRPAKKRRVSLGGAVLLDGEMLRTSTRKSVISFRQAVDQREKEDEERRAAMAPKLAAIKQKKRKLTQAELIEEALQTEELNRASLQAFYAEEEERKEAQQGGAKWAVLGPKVVFWSRTEGVPEKMVQVVEEGETEPPVVAGEKKQPEPEASEIPEPTTIDPDRQQERLPSDLESFPHKSSSQNFTSLPYSETTPIEPITKADSTLPPPEAVTLQPSTPEAGPAPSSASASVRPSLPPPSISFQEPNHNRQFPQSSVESPASYPPIQPTQSSALELQQGPYSRNYVMILDYQGATRAQEMHALFGDHCEWAKVKAIPTKNRVISEFTAHGENVQNNNDYDAF
jgi:hypothetical protein